MPKTKIVLIVVILLSVVIVLGSLAIKFFAPFLTVKFFYPQLGQIVKDDGTVKLPIDIENPAVFAATLNYTFEGRIKEVVKDGENLVLKTDFDITGVPPFRVTPQTDVFFLDRNFQSKPAKLADLRPNLKIRIITLYGLKIKRWTISRVNILVSNLPDSSPSATLR